MCFRKVEISKYVIGRKKFLMLNHICGIRPQIIAEIKPAVMKCTTCLLQTIVKSGLVEVLTILDMLPLNFTVTQQNSYK